MSSPTDGAVSPPVTRPARTLVVILAVLAVLIVTALVVVLTRGDSVVLDPATPAGTVQAYATAVIAGDKQVAASYLSSDAIERCTPGMMTGATDRLRLRLLSTDERADSARVRVSMTVSGDGPFDPSGAMEDVFDLVRVDGKWKVDVAPWQLTVCPATEATP